MSAQWQLANDEFGKGTRDLGCHTASSELVEVDGLASAASSMHYKHIYDQCAGARRIRPCITDQLQCVRASPDGRNAHMRQSPIAALRTH